jgi:hypothetical protein
MSAVFIILELAQYTSFPILSYNRDIIATAMVIILLMCAKSISLPTQNRWNLVARVAFSTTCRYGIQIFVN